MQKLQIQVKTFIKCLGMQRQYSVRIMTVKSQQFHQPKLFKCQVMLTYKTWEGWLVANSSYISTGMKQQCIPDLHDMNYIIIQVHSAFYCDKCTTKDVNEFEFHQRALSEQHIHVVHTQGMLVCVSGTYIPCLHIKNRVPQGSLWFFQICIVFFR